MGKNNRDFNDNNNSEDDNNIRNSKKKSRLQFHNTEKEYINKKKSRLQFDNSKKKREGVNAKKFRRWTFEEHSKIITLFQEGFSIEKIAVILERSARTTFGELVRIVQEQYDKGLSKKELSDFLKIDEESIDKILNTEMYIRKRPLSGNREEMLIKLEDENRIIKLGESSTENRIIKFEESSKKETKSKLAELEETSKRQNNFFLDAENRITKLEEESMREIDFMRDVNNSLKRELAREKTRNNQLEFQINRLKLENICLSL